MKRVLVRFKKMLGAEGKHYPREFKVLGAIKSEDLTGIAKISYGHLRSPKVTYV
jgi:hypothetical protein